MFLRRKTIADQTDEVLVDRLIAGDQASLAALWDRYAQLLFGVGMKYLKDTERSKDAVLELFAALPGLVVKSPVKTFRPWVHVVMRNRCLMLLRAKGGPAHAVEVLPDAAEEDLQEQRAHEADLQRLEAAVERLGPGQRECIQAFYLERKSYQDVALRTGFSLEQVRSHLQNGRRNLRLILERQAEQP